MNRETKQLIEVVISIIDAGLGAKYENPYFIHVFDADGQPWPVPVWEMGRAEIINYVRNRFGDECAQMTAEAPALTLH